jgi:hypothetical protein
MDKIILDACLINGKKYKVSPDVSEKDQIFRWIIENEYFKNKTQAVDYYFKDGWQSAKILKSLVKELYPKEKSKLSLLEFASGHGRVTRHLVNLLPELSVTACDIHEDANKFISDQLGIGAVQSTSSPEDFNPTHKYDIVFALSFF